MKLHNLFLLALASSIAVIGCDKENTTPATERPHKYISDESKVKMLNSLQTLDKDRLYIMNYTCDYKLQDVIDAQPKTSSEFLTVLSVNLFDNLTKSTPSFTLNPGCSIFAATNKSTGDFMMGRNYDYCHSANGKEVSTTAVAVFTTPEGGKKSISFVDPNFAGLPNGFYTDGTTDISALMFAPYLGLDGMNEDGLAYGILYLKGRPAMQSEAGKPNIYCMVALRAILDRYSTVDEAIEFLKGYNMSMGDAEVGSLHFYLADASGDYSIVEYSFEDPSSVTAETVPTRLTIMKGDDAYRYVTNFYVDPRLKDCEYGGKSVYARDRYNILKAGFDSFGPNISETKAKSYLQAVSQEPNPAENTSHTQWSNLYNLTDRSVQTAILQEYGKWYEFSLK